MAMNKLVTYQNFTYLLTNQNELGLDFLSKNGIQLSISNFKRIELR